MKIRSWKWQAVILMAAAALSLVWNGPGWTSSGKTEAGAGKTGDMSSHHPRESESGHHSREPESPGGRPAITFGDKFYDVALQGQKAWAVGYFGAIVHSRDGGSTWQRQNAGTVASLLSVSFVNEKVGWIVGDQALILHTWDGGVTWTAQKSPAAAEKLLKVQFLDEKTGFAVGSYGTILRSDDSGSLWRRLPFEEDVTLNDLVFLNSLEGWIVGEFDTILHTSDGGETWERQNGDGMGQLFGVDFHDKFLGVAVGTAGKTLRTSDGGKTWTETAAADADADTLLKVLFSKDTSVLAVGLRGTVLTSADSGATWTPVVIPGHYNWLSGMVFDNQGKGVLVGNQGSILANPSGRDRWVQIGMRLPAHP